MCITYTGSYYSYVADSDGTKNVDINYVPCTIPIYQKWHALILNLKLTPTKECFNHMGSVGCTSLHKFILKKGNHNNFNILAFADITTCRIVATYITSLYLLSSPVTVTPRCYLDTPIFTVQ